MPPAVRKQPSRNTLPQPSASGSASAFASASTSNPVQQSRRDDALSDFQRRRLARRLDELERTNPTDIPATSFIPQSQAASALHPTANANANKKKQSANVRRILYGKKSLKDWLDELPPDPPNPYTTSTSPIPRNSRRKICSSCGYIGAYKCPRCAEWSCDKECMEVHERDGGCGVGG
ncbi:uncharacterized protein I303_106306 [Kwoniella dejecticola CBS 10117]|uniref:Zinc finger HIT domain-containing protein 1 n=1 Tax=Kwoniella dejecticola CBS 10117 TaxID=1296121 RepID=A0AAJ8KTX9_9TREE